MAILKSLRAQWDAMTTAEKIGTVLDIICGIGSSAAAGAVSAELVKQRKSKIEKVCIPVMMCGIGWRIGAIAKDSIMENFGTPAGNLIDKCKTEHKEEKADE